MANMSSRGRRKRPTLAALALVMTASAAFAEDKAEVYNATASLKTAAGASVPAPVIISIQRWTTDAERERWSAR